MRTLSPYFPSRSQQGFSLIELLIAMTITVGVSAVAFQLFQQNSRVFHDQDTIMDAQQMARAAVSEIADEIRMAGQGVPLFSATYDGAATGGTVTDGLLVVMAGSGRSRINLRSGRSNVEAIVVSPASPTLTVGTTTTLSITDATLFSNAAGSAPAGKFAFVWGPTVHGWGWVRASLLAISNKTSSIQLTPAEIGGNAQSIQFAGAPTVTLEEAVTIYFDSASSSIRRTTATDMSNPTLPGWAPANDMAAHVNDLSFTYYDRIGTAIEPDTAAHRASIARVDFEVGIEVENPLSSGLKPEYRFSTRVVPRNLKIQ